MPSVLCHQRPQIPGIRKTLKMDLSPFRETHHNIRIQCLQKLYTISYLSVCHIKFITFAPSGHNHQITGTDLLLGAAFHTLLSFINPQDIPARKIIHHHMSGKDQISILNPYFSIFHNDPPNADFRHVFPLAFSLFLLPPVACVQVQQTFPILFII